MKDIVKIGEFRLCEKFLAPYKTTKPKFGPLGEFVYKRTYAATKPDGVLEDWWETVQRVVEGTFQIQRGHCDSLHLPWDTAKARASAEEMYDRMFNFKFLPPGRGLARMGTPGLTKVGGACLNNPLAGHEELYTRDGLVRIDSLAEGRVVEVWTGAGWRPATSKCYGVQRLQEIELKPQTAKGSRTNYRVVKTATPDHGWYLADGTRTHDLKVGDEVDCIGPSVGIDEEGLRHGYMFADGSCTYSGTNGYLHQMRLCGWKKKVASLYDRLTFPESSSPDPWARHNSPTNYKILPEADKPLAYHASFVQAWMEFDGHEKGSGICLDTSEPDAVTYLQKWAPVVGYTIVGLSVESAPTNYGTRSRPLHRVKLARVENVSFKVERVTEVAPELVYCLHVPGEHEFALVSGVRSLNCGFVSTENMHLDFAYPFRWLLEMSFLGVGVGFDTKGSGKAELLRKRSAGAPFVIADSREGWSEYLGACLNSMVDPQVPTPIPDYSLVRPKGAPIKTFGGVASGPEALVRLTERLDALFELYAGKTVDSRFIVDVGNSVGECVISGGTRRTAEIAFGEFGDEGFLGLKDYANNPEATEWPRWVSNNSFFADSESDFQWVQKHIAQNGEPGLIFLENARKYGRMIDPPDWKDRKAKGANPCVEQTLEHQELCCLVETFPSKHEDLADYKKTLKFAYMYAKTVTLIPTHSAATNAVMMRNRRIGCSQSGIQDNIARHGVREHMRWCDEGYHEIQRLDAVYADWLCVPRSIKTTSVKPSGTVSKLVGVREGIHESKGEYEFQTVRVREGSPLLPELERTNHRIVDDPYAPSTKVVYFAAHYPRTRARQPTMWEQLELAALMQAYWADNQVSVTIDFDRDSEGPEIAHALDMYAGRLKGLSFLPRDDHGYQHAPKQVITKAEYDEYVAQLGEPDFSGALSEARDMEDKFCDGDACALPDVG